MTEVSPEIQALEQRRELIQVKFQQRKEQLQRELDEEIKHIERNIDGVRQRERQRQMAQTVEIKK
tara:strand:- start:44 stop:238 length:195 start_codon:yes stop_codon:yes gene_type:complete